MTDAIYVITLLLFMLACLFIGIAIGSGRELVSFFGG